MSEMSTVSDTSSGAGKDPQSSDKIIYLIKGNKAFTRLLEIVLDEIQDYAWDTVSMEELNEKLKSRRPDLMVIIDNADLYCQIRGRSELHDIPVLYVTVSEFDDKKMPVLAEGDQAWILKNSSAELMAILNDMIPESGRKHLLCADDSPTVLRQIKRVFEGTPYIVHTATNGQEALRSLDKMIPDLIVTDIEMPVMDGLTFCREVRKKPGTAEIPLIILSSRIDYETISHGFESGADEYLTKPFFPDELLNKVESYLVPPQTRRKETILVFSENATVIHQLKMALDKQGFEVMVASDPKRAFEMSLLEDTVLIISDTEIQGLTGYQFCGQIRSEPALKRIPFVVLTVKTDTVSRKMGKKVGVSAYLVKPFTREGLLTLVERLIAENRSLKALEWDMVLAGITSLAKALDERDPYTRFHSESVARYAVIIGRKDGLHSKDLEILRLAGLLHDIGKIGVPDRILLKPDRLSEEEFKKIKEHPRRGAEILSPFSNLGGIIPAIEHHHERIDGQGYPDGLGGEDIPLMARILAVADTFDALVTDRPYRKGMSRKVAVSIMTEVAGTQLSARHVKLFLSWLKEQA